MAQQILSTNTFLSSTWIVNSNATKGTHTTLAGAMASASSGDTILLQTSVTENVTLTPGVNITGYSGANIGTPNVSITGTLTMTGVGAATITNVQLITNSSNFLVVSGSANSQVFLINCYLNCSNNTGISYSSSGSTSSIYMFNCQGNIGTTGISLFSGSGAGNITMQNCNMQNSGSSVTASTMSSGVLAIEHCTLVFPITTTSTGVLQINNCNIAVQAGTNTTIITHGGSSTNSSIFNSYLVSGTASCVSIGSTITMGSCVVSSSNTNAITGAGTLINAGISFVSTSYKINTSTQTAAQFDVGGISFDGGTNLLTIFQQGTFSPTIIGSSTAGAPNMTTQVGRYQKVGRIVTVNISAQWTTLGSATGSPQCNNLPYTSLNNSNIAGLPSIVSSGISQSITTATGGVPICQINNNAATANINYYLGSSGSGTAGVITATNGFVTILVYETT